MSQRRYKLISFRKVKKLTQKDVVVILKNAHDIEITESYYGMIEQGVRTPKLNIALAISDIFETEANEIFFWGKTQQKVV